MNPERTPESAKIISPFAHTEATVSEVSPRKSNIIIWVVFGIVLVAVGIGVGLAVNNYLNDPYRTLEVFPVTKYLQEPNTLYGSRFKADIRVENSLGWKENVGNVMIFSSTADSNLMAIMVPAAVSKNVSFSKGQTYTAELEVKEGGLIYANAIRKN